MTKNNKFPFSRYHFIFLMVIAVISPFCKTAQKAVSTTTTPTLSFEQNILPIMTQSCTPCHFPETGRKKVLDTYDAVKDNIVDIMARVQLPQDDPKFMPFKGKKPALTEAEINQFKEWVAQGMPK